MLTDQNGSVLFKALGAVPQLGVEINGSTMKLSSSLDVDLTKLTVKRNDQTIGRVLYNGTPVSFKDANGYIYFGSEPILIGEEKPGNSGTASQKPAHGGGSGGGTGSSSIGGNTQTSPGGMQGIPNKPQPKDPAEQMKQELRGHWAEDEISFLVIKRLFRGKVIAYI